MYFRPVKYGTLLLLLSSLFGCETTNRVNNDAQSIPLGDNEGYLSLVIDSLDPLKTLEFENKNTGSSFYEGRAPKGISLVTLKVTEGEYCFIGFDVYNWRVDYKNKGFCTYVEAGEINYMGELVIRDPVTQIYNNYPRFIRMLNKEFPNLCKSHIGSSECK